LKPTISIRDEFIQERITLLLSLNETEPLTGDDIAFLNKAYWEERDKDTTESTDERARELSVIEAQRVHRVVRRILLGGDQLSRLRSACTQLANSHHVYHRKACAGTESVIENFHMMMEKYSRYRKKDSTIVGI
jgi:hypothetical protein